MEKENLLKLKSIVQDMSVMYVEDSNVLQIQLSRFLSRLFKNVYQAYDGEDGLEQYKKYKPEVVLTDITMPKKNGLDMLKDIKEISDDVKTFVLSAHNDDEIILESIGIHIDDFLLKPLDIDKFTQSLLHAFSDHINSEEEKCLHDLNIIYQQHGHVTFMNHYKGIPIEREGTIIDINDGILVAKVTALQLVAIAFEKQTVIELKSINKYIHVTLLKVDKENHTIQFKSPRYIENYIRRNVTHKRVKVDSDFILSLFFHNKVLEHVRVLDISFIAAAFIFEDDYGLNVGDEIDMTFGFFVKNNNELIQDKKLVKMFTKAKVTKIDHIATEIKVVVSFDVQKADETNFKKYLSQREMDTIRELQHF